MRRWIGPRCWVAAWGAWCWAGYWLWRELPEEIGNPKRASMRWTSDEDFARCHGGGRAFSQFFDSADRTACLESNGHELLDHRRSWRRGRLVDSCSRTIADLDASFC